jgi:hypothetical protein
VSLLEGRLRDTSETSRVDKSMKWGRPRYVALVVVLALHLGVIAALLLWSRTKILPGSSVQSVELLILPGINPPKVHAQNTSPKGLSHSIVMTITPTAPDIGPTSTSPLAAASPDGSGSGVDWAAEARRALHAFEIRNHQPSGHTSISIRPEENNWWPHQKHHAGERFKTANGDWIVWINASCYQVADSAPSNEAAGATPLATTCLDDIGQPVGN